MAVCFISLFFRANAIIARTTVILLNEIVIVIKLNPMGVSPRNNPVMPDMPKLRAMLSTASSIMSILSLFLKSILTRQLPGMRNIKTTAKAERMYPNTDSDGMM